MPCFLRFLERARSAFEGGNNNDSNNNNYNNNNNNNNRQQHIYIGKHVSTATSKSWTSGMNMNQ